MVEYELATGAVTNEREQIVDGEDDSSRREIVAVDGRSWVPSPDGKLLVTYAKRTFRDPIARGIIADARTGKEIRSFGELIPFNYFSHAAQSSDDGKMLAMLDGHGNLRSVTLGKSPALGIVPEWGGSRSRTFEDRLEFFPGQRIGKFSKEFDLYDRHGSRLAGAKIRDLSFAGRVGKEGVFLRDRNQAAVYRIVGDAVEQVARIPNAMWFSADGQFAVVGGGVDRPVSLFAAPDWNRFCAISDQARLPWHGSMTLSPKDGRLKWLSRDFNLIALDLETKAIDEVKQFERPLNFEVRPSRTCAGVLIVRTGNDRGEAGFTLISVDSEEICFERAFENGADAAFPDEVGLELMDLTPDREHGWFCSVAGNFILVELATGRAKLRIHTWQDGGYLFETAEHEFAGNPIGLKKVVAVNADRTQAEPVRDWPEEEQQALWARIHSLLHRTQAPSS